MIIIVRGNNGSGKSTVVRTVKNRVIAAPVYGILGPRNPEAYRCHGRLIKPFEKPLYILGPYEQPTTAGGDYITKKGVQATMDIFDKYLALGHVLFESIMTSIRFMEPSIGAWLDAHRKSVCVVTLKTSIQECQEAIAIRQKASIAVAHPSKHLIDNQKRFEGVSRTLAEKGFLQVYVDREEAPDVILGLL